MKKPPFIHEKDLEKYVVDNDDKRIFINVDFTLELYKLLKDVEETFFYPIDDHRNEFNIFIINPIGNIDCNAGGMKSKDDETLSTAVFRLTQVMPQSPKVLVDILSSKENIRRIKYIIEKHNLQDIIKIPEHYKKFFSEKEQKIRDPISKSIRHEVFKKDNYRCIECGATNTETILHVDHIIPKSAGGTDELSNLQTLCDKCNLAKSNRKWEGGK
jgi:hypothetical protein